MVTPTATMAGLYVSRKVTVPASGSQDFARTVDSFQNPTASPITTTVTILGNLGSDAATTVFATSDGTGVVSPNDQWIGTDNGNGGPAVITFIHGPLGLVPTSVSLVGDNITWTYSLTVPAGQTVELAYFTIVGASRAGAIAAANTLVTGTAFGGHAADYLSSTDLSRLANFSFFTATARELYDKFRGRLLRRKRGRAPPASRSAASRFPTRLSASCSTARPWARPPPIPPARPPWRTSAWVAFRPAPIPAASP